MDAPGWGRSPFELALPTRATSRDGCGGFTAARPPRAPADPRHRAGFFTTPRPLVSKPLPEGAAIEVRAAGRGGVTGMRNQLDGSGWLTARLPVAESVRRRGHSR